MPKVCHLTSAHGVEDVRIFHKECVTLAKAGYDVYLVERGDTYYKNEVCIVGVGNIPRSRLKRMTQGAKKVYQKALEIDADLYHFHDPELLPYGLKLKRRGKKVIFDSHERYTEQFLTKDYLPKPIARIVAYVYEIYERYALKHLDGVVIPSTLNGINPFHNICKHTVIINNTPILKEFYDLLQPTTEKKLNQLCYVGGVTEDRGITNTILAAYRTRATLVLGGPFFSSEYKERIKALNEFSCVDYRGILNRKEVVALLQESSVGLCILRNRGQYWKADNFASKVYEYMSMGLPVILNYSPYNITMVRMYHFGICVDPENIDEIANAIQYLLNHPDEARQMGENGRRAVKKEFNWGVEEKKLLRFYEKILNNE